MTGRWASPPWRRVLALVLVAWPAILAARALAAASEPVATERHALWSGRAPLAGGEFEAADAWMTLYRPLRPDGRAILICPGGGYASLVIELEGHGVARWLSQQGIFAAVLEYRLPRGRPEVPPLDGQRALRCLRSRAGEWGIAPDRIGVMGFSAGGHLAARLGTQFELGDASAADAIERVSSRPDFLVLVYPVLDLAAPSMAEVAVRLLGAKPSTERIRAYSPANAVDERAPPTFLAHARDDRLVPFDGSHRFFDALRAHGVAAHFFDVPTGGHRFGGREGEVWAAFQRRLLAWLQRFTARPIREP